MKAKGKEQEIIMTQAAQPAYKDSQVWQKSMSFANKVLQIIDELETSRKHYHLFEQIESAVS